MVQLVDTSIFVQLERAGLDLDDLGNAAPDQPAAISAITASELLVGVHRADSPKRRKARKEFVDAILEVLPILPFGLAESKTHARLMSMLMSKGQMIGSHDLIIAATALTNGCSVLTGNLREFRRIPRLKVIQPSWK